MARRLAEAIAACCIGVLSLPGCGPSSEARLEKAFAESVEFYRTSKAFLAPSEIIESVRPFVEDEAGHDFLVARLRSSSAEEAVTTLMHIAVMYDIYAQSSEGRERLRKRFDVAWYLRREKELLPLAQGGFRKWLEINQECGFGRGRKP